MADEQDELDTYSEPRRPSGNYKHTEASGRGRAKLLAARSLRSRGDHGHDHGRLRAKVTAIMERTIKASEFKATCLKLMDEVAESGDEVIITKNGSPVSRLVPYRERPKSLFGCLRGQGEITGDIISPLNDEWGGWDGERELALIRGEDPD